MITWEEIEKNTIYVVRYSDGHRITGTYEEIKHFLDENPDEPYIKDFGPVGANHQPIELKPFWEAHYYAITEQNRTDLIDEKEFYKEWSKNPSQFMPNHRPILPQKLSEIISSYKPTEDMIIKNYDGYGIGNHKVKNFIEALKNLSIDFDCVEVTEAYGYKCIIIQDDDKDKLQNFSYESNHNALVSMGY